MAYPTSPEPSPGQREIKVNPEGWDEMVKKYKERDEEREQRVIEKYKEILAKEKQGGKLGKELEHVTAISASHLKQIAKIAIDAHTQRAASDQKTLPNREILTEPKSDEIKKFRKELSEEISEIGRRILSPGSPGKSSQKGEGQ